ncbi:hypothetical protein Ancab_010786 [Ancistrocladus abbreviatus]
MEVNNNYALLVELKSIWIGSFKLIVDLARDRVQLGERNHLPDGKEEGKVANRGLASNEGLDRLPLSGQRKSFAKVVC